MLSFFKNVVRLSGLLGSILVLCAACAIPFDAANAPQITTIALSGFDEPEYSLIGGGYFGRSNDEFVALMARENLHLGTELKTALTQSLANAGYQIVEGSNAGNADATLNITLAGWQAGRGPAYSSSPSMARSSFFGGTYGPEFTVKATLADARTKRTLFFGYYIYRDNPIAPLDGSILLRPNAKYAFKTDDEIFANPKLAVEGLRAGVPMVAQAIATSLKKP